MSAKLEKIELTYDNNELYDKKHSVSNKIRVETISVVELPQPPEGSLSELVYLKKIEEIEKRLLEANEDPNQRDCSGETISWTPLYWAIKSGEIEIARLLLKHGADLNMVVNDCEECFGTVLDLVAIRGDKEMEKVLKEFAEETNVVFGQSFKAIRTRLRGKAPACSFKFNGRKKD